MLVPEQFTGKQIIECLYLTWHFIFHITPFYLLKTCQFKLPEDVLHRAWARNEMGNQVTLLIFTSGNQKRLAALSASTATVTSLTQFTWKFEVCLNFSCSFSFKPVCRYFSILHLVFPCYIYFKWFTVIIDCMLQKSFFFSKTVTDNNLCVRLKRHIHIDLKIELLRSLLSFWTLYFVIFFLWIIINSHLLCFSLKSNNKMHW